MQIHSEKKNLVLLLSPFAYKSNKNYNVNVDSTISRHSGAKTKNGAFYPTGLGYISSILKQAGFPVRLMDPGPQSSSVAQVLAEAEKANFIIMPISAPRYEETTSFLKNYRNKIRIGISNFASIYAEKLLKEGVCDIICHGEVEQTCSELVQAYYDSGKPELSKINGISFIDQNGTIIKTASRPLTDKLDSIPFPDREGFDQNLYNDVAFFGAPTAYILTARGCPFKCTFCSTHLTYNYKVNYRSPENVVAEVESVIRNHGIKNFFFIDDTFTLVPSRVKKICDLIMEKKLDIQWACLGRLDVLNDEMLVKMKAAGCIEVRMGAESGNDSILKNTKKDLTVTQIEKGINLMKKHKMRYTLFFMIGNQGETKETVLQTIRFAKKLNPIFASFNISTPLPGSELFERYKESFQFNDIQTFNTVSSNFSVCDLSPKQLRHLLLYAYFSYYFRPSFFMKLFSELIQRPKDTGKIIYFLFQQARAVVS